MSLLEQNLLAAISEADDESWVPPYWLTDPARPELRLPPSNFPLRKYVDGPRIRQARAMSSMIPLAPAFPLGSTVSRAAPQQQQGANAVARRAWLEELCPSGLSFVPVPSAYATRPQTMLEFRMRYGYAIRVVDFAGPVPAALGRKLAGWNTFALNQSGEMRLRVKWPGYHSKEYRIFIHPIKTMLDLVREVCRLVFDYLREFGRRHLEEAINTYGAWVLQDDTFPQSGGIPKERIWLDSVAYCPQNQCYTPQLYVQTF